MCYRAGKSYLLSCFETSSLSWNGHILLPCFAAHKGYDFGEPSHGGLQYLLPELNSQFKSSFLCFRYFPICVTLFIYTETTDLLFFHLWITLKAAYSKAPLTTSTFPQSPAVMEQHLTFLSKAKKLKRATLTADFWSVFLGRSSLLSSPCPDPMSHWLQTGNELLSRHKPTSM